MGDVITELGRVWPLTKLRFDASGRVAPHGYTVFPCATIATYALWLTQSVSWVGGSVKGRQNGDI